MTWIIVVGLVAVLVALASAGVFMLRRPGASKEETDKRMARALAVRVGLSITLFLLILVAWKLGWIAPKGIPTGR
jgi:hypothetical protein